MSISGSAGKKIVMSGLNELRKTIDAHKKRLHADQRSGLKDIGTIVSDDIKVSMTNTEKTEDWTKWVRRGKNKIHKPSIDNKPPAVDYGNLRKAIGHKVVEDKDGMVCYVGVMQDVKYAAALEFGRLDGSIAPRPYIRPAVARNEKKVNDRLKKVVTHKL